MFRHQTNTRVRYGETDQMGYLYYGNYALYYEVGRVEAMRSLGIIYKELEEKHGILMPVLDVQSKFIKPARYDELVDIHTMIPMLPQSRIHFDFELYNEQKELIHTATVRLCFINSKNNRPIRVPDNVIQPLKPYFE